MADTRPYAPTDETGQSISEAQYAALEIDLAHAGPTPESTTDVSASSNLPTKLEPMPGISPPVLPGLVRPPVRPPWVPDWRTGAPRAVLGKTPNTLGQILLAPFAGTRPSRVTGPLLSGPIGTPNGAVGAAVLTLPLWIDWSMGNFTLSIQFPPGSVVLWMATLTYRDWNGVDNGTPRKTAVSLGSSPGGGEIIPLDGFDTLHLLHFMQAVGTLPFAIDPNPFQGWLDVRQYNATAGEGAVLIGYARI